MSQSVRRDPRADLTAIKELVRAGILGEESFPEPDRLPKRLRKDYRDYHEIRWYVGK